MEGFRPSSALRREPLKDRGAGIARLAEHENRRLIVREKGIGGISAHVRAQGDRERMSPSREPSENRAGVSLGGGVYVAPLGIHDDGNVRGNDVHRQFEGTDTLWSVRFVESDIRLEAESVRCGRFHDSPVGGEYGRTGIR